VFRSGGDRLTSLAPCRVTRGSKEVIYEASRRRRCAEGQEAMLTSLVILVAFAAAWLIDGPSGVVLYPLIVVGAHAHSLTIVTGQ
jgi:hypothetical protein